MGMRPQMLLGSVAWKNAPTLHGTCVMCRPLCQVGRAAVVKLGLIHGRIQSLLQIYARFAVMACELSFAPFAGRGFLPSSAGWAEFGFDSASKQASRIRGVTCKPRLLAIERTNSQA